MSILNGGVTRFPNGISTDCDGGLMGDLGLPNPTNYHSYFEDFDSYNAADWTVTAVGTPTQALANEDGGVLLVTNSAAEDDSCFLQKVGASFQFEVGKKLFFESKFKLNEAIQSDFIFGLQIPDTTPVDVTDGVFFSKADASASITLEVEKDDVATSTVVGDLVDDTYIRLGFYYNGVDRILAYVDGVQVGSSAVTNLPDDEVLTISYGAQNGEAVAKSMSIDSIYVAKEK